MIKLIALILASTQFIQMVKVNVLLNKYAEATEVDRSDVYETYEATYDLAKAYDSLMNKLLANKK